jgi:phosphomannomutase
MTFPAECKLFRAGVNFRSAYFVAFLKVDPDMSSLEAPLMISISGLRGLIGSSLTPEVASRYAGCFGQWLRMNRGDQDCSAPHVVIGRDSRPSGPMIEAAVVAGLLAAGCRVTRTGILTTPGVAIMTRHLQAQGGIVITASHNPIQWNGLKLLRHDGVAPPAEQAQAIINLYHSNEPLKLVDVHALQEVDSTDDAIQVHLDRVLSQVNTQLIQSAKLKVVLDSVHGAGGPETAALLATLGVDVIHLYAEPTGQFPHTPEPLKENLTELARSVTEHQADAGFAQDPDADRLAIVDDTGCYIGEEYTLALCTLHVLDRLSRQDTNRAKGAWVGANLSTSRMVDDIAQKYEARVCRAAVGEANVAATMRAHHASIGGEGNGGIILPASSYIRDSLIGIALVLEMLAFRKKKLASIVSEIPTYAIIKDKMPVDPAVVARLKPVLSQTFADQKIDTQDGVRIDWPDKWVHVRPSNTEPILRLIAEAKEAGEARKLIDQVRGALGIA